MNKGSSGNFGVIHSSSPFASWNLDPSEYPYNLKDSSNSPIKVCLFEFFPDEENLICTRKAVADNIYKPKCKRALGSSEWMKNEVIACDEKLDSLLNLVTN